MNCIVRHPLILLIGLVSLVVAAGCSDSGAVRPADAPAATVASVSRPRIVVLGDSLTAGLGLAVEEAFPSVLQRRMDEEGYRFEVVNAGVSGDTSAGGLRRLDWALEGDTRILVLALGANDGLRGLPVAEMRRNLGAIIERAQARHVDVLLAGMEAPPNFGAAYTQAFREAFRDLAARYRIRLVPFFLQGVAGMTELNQPDGIHPSAAGSRIVANNLWPVLKTMAAAATGS